MRLCVSILRLLIVLAGVVAMFIAMTYLGVFAHWAASLGLAYSIPIVIVFLGFCLAIAIWMEKREASKAGQKYRLFSRWNND